MSVGQAHLVDHVTAVKPPCLLERELGNIPPEFRRRLIGKVQHSPVGDYGRGLESFQAAFNSRIDLIRFGNLIDQQTGGWLTCPDLTAAQDYLPGEPRSRSQRYLPRRPR